MKNHQLICISLAVMLSLVSCFNEGGYNTLITTSNGDPNSCLLRMTYQIQALKYIFTVEQIIPDPINRSCTYQDIVTAPLFYDIPFTAVNLNLTAIPGNPNILKAEWTKANMIANLGTACTEIGTFSGQKGYTCRFKWSSIFLYLDIWMVPPTNSSFDTTSTGVLFTEWGSTMNSTKYGYPISVPNNTFPHIIGRIMDGCFNNNNWDNTVNNLNVPLTVTGTEYLSNTFDLFNYLQGMIEYNVIALKKGSPASTYRMVQTAVFPFSAPGANNCTNMGVKYGDFLPNLNYCLDGCGVSIIVYAAPYQLVLRTNGIHTAPSRLRL